MINALIDVETSKNDSFLAQIGLERDSVVTLMSVLENLKETLSIEDHLNDKEVLERSRELYEKVLFGLYNVLEPAEVSVITRWGRSADSISSPYSLRFEISNLVKLMESIFQIPEFELSQRVREINHRQVNEQITQEENRKLNKSILHFGFE